MIFTAILSNPDHPEYGVVSVPFPIPNNQYDEITEMLRQLEIGDPIMQDCKLEEISGETSVLKHMEKRASMLTSWIISRSGWTALTNTRKHSLRALLIGWACVASMS